MFIKAETRWVCRLCGASTTEYVSEKMRAECKRRPDYSSLYCKLLKWTAIADDEHLPPDATTATAATAPISTSTASPPTDGTLTQPEKAEMPQGSQHVVGALSSRVPLEVISHGGGTPRSLSLWQITGGWGEHRHTNINCHHQFDFETPLGSDFAAAKSDGDYSNFKTSLGSDFAAIRLRYDTLSEDVDSEREQPRNCQNWGGPPRGYGVGQCLLGRRGPGSCCNRPSNRDLSSPKLCRDREDALGCGGRATRRPRGLARQA